MITHSELDLRIQQIRLNLQRAYRIMYSDIEDYNTNPYKQQQVRQCYAKVYSNYKQLHKHIDN